MSERLLLDMDGVLADTMGRARQIIQDEHLTQIDHNHIKDYWFAGLPVEPKVFVEILRRPGFYRDLDVIAGAVQAVNKLRTQYDVVVCTAPMAGSKGDCETEKREWLAEHFDQDFAEVAIVTQDKTTVPGKLIVEDNPHIDRDASWRVLLFDQPWNRHVEDLPRMMNWSQSHLIEEYMYAVERGY